MGKGHVLTVIMLAVMLTVPVLGAPMFDVTIEPAQQTIKLNETAEFDLILSHQSPGTEYFEIYSPDVLWDISTKPSSGQTITVPPDEDVTTRLLIRPLYVQPGFYGVTLHIKNSNTKELVQKDVRIGVARESFGQYLPSIRPSISMPEKVNPLEEVTIKVRLENQNRRNLDTINLKLRSQLINKDYTTSLKPLESKEVEFKAKLDPATPPQRDYLKISVFTDMDDESLRFDLPVHSYMVVPYGSVEENVNADHGLLKSEIAITILNEGNVEREEKIEYPIGWFARWFASSNRDYSVVTNNEGRFLVWDRRFKAGEEETITLTINYWPGIWLLILLGALYGLYYVLRSPLVVKKGAMVIQSKEGSISELKVFIRMRNRSRNTIHDCVVLDMVPPFADVMKEFEVGTLNPDKVVRHEKKGTQLKWTIDSLEPHEERIMSYKIKTRISILGGFKLPPCQVKFKSFNYERLTYSTVENLFNR